MRECLEQEGVPECYFVAESVSNLSWYSNRNLKGARARFQGRVSKPSFSGEGAWCVWMAGRRPRRLSSMYRLESSRVCHQSWASGVCPALWTKVWSSEVIHLTVNKHQEVWSRGVMSWDFSSVEGLHRETRGKEGINTYFKVENIQTMPRHSILHPLLRAFTWADLRKNGRFREALVLSSPAWDAFQGLASVFMKRLIWLDEFFLSLFPSPYFH